MFVLSVGTTYQQVNRLVNLNYRCCSLRMTDLQEGCQSSSNANTEHYSFNDYKFISNFKTTLSSIDLMIINSYKILKLKLILKLIIIKRKKE